uniref:Uncharacterized protein n=1 Tax=Hyaloperonospora arabidopsidis (strain Emoy2) TaxID=559515 RepID=M4BS90_HYAAE
MATTYWILWGPASPGPPTIRCRGFMLRREAKLSGTGVSGCGFSLCKVAGPRGNIKMRWKTRARRN